MFTIKVTRIENRWHARLYELDTVVDEIACYDRRDIREICRYMLRWQHKLGYVTAFSTAARERYDHKEFHGKVVFHLPIKKPLRKAGKPKLPLRRHK